MSPPERLGELSPEPSPLPGAGGGALLSVRGLRVTFPSVDGMVKAVDGIDVDVHENEVLGIVGESGSGKSVTAMAMLGLLNRSARIEGEIFFRGTDLLLKDEREYQRLRGGEIAMVFQDALAALNPVFTVGNQIAEAITAHNPKIHRAERRNRVIELLDLVGISDPKARVDQYPHEFSGGMRQRAMIAMAIANDPAVLIADEPTTALDVTIQAQVLEVIERVQERTRTAIVLITHDVGIVAGVADRVLVMYAGRAVEVGTVDEIFYETRHPYTLGLLASLPRLDRREEGERLYRIKGQPPSLVHLPPGCAFHPRCEIARVPKPCAVDPPVLRTAGGVGHLSSCHFAEDLVGIGAIDLRAMSPGGRIAGWKRGEAGGSPGPVGDVISGAVANPQAGGVTSRPRGETLLEVRELVKHFPTRSGLLRRPSGAVHAVCGLSFDVGRGETVAMVGESGCGKSTTGRVLLKLLPATSGSVRFRGTEVLTTNASEIRALRADIQVVFQDPYASLNPRMTVNAIISEPLRVHKRWDKDGPTRVKELLRLVGLNPEHVNRFPHEFSGGQRQRIGIARALALDPHLLVLDEPVSALDVSIQAGVINLLEELQDGLGLSYLFIAHDLSVVRHIADRVAVMYLGKIVEIGDRDGVYERPAHPYTQALLSAVPVPDPRRERRRRRIILVGDPPAPNDPPSGCRFRTRCWKAQDICAQEEPALVDRGQGHPVACHFAESQQVV